jgi:MarR family transcriptional regulator, organic hydroperoxide resistance regulator
VKKTIAKKAKATVSAQINVNDRSPEVREAQVAARVGELHDVDFTAMAAVSNVYRVASAVRHVMERDVLGPDGLSWTGFTALWVLWIWGPQEARHLADECGVTKGTLTGVVGTLESKGLLRRSTHPDDGRLVLVELTPRGLSTIKRLFPLFNKHESAVVSTLTESEQQQLASLLRKVLRNVE